MRRKPSNPQHGMPSTVPDRYRLRKTKEEAETAAAAAARPPEQQGPESASGSPGGGPQQQKLVAQRESRKSVRRTSLTSQRQSSQERAERQPEEDNGVAATQDLANNSQMERFRVLVQRARNFAGFAPGGTKTRRARKELPLLDPHNPEHR